MSLAIECCLQTCFISGRTMFDAAMGNMRKCRNYCSSPHLDWIAFTRGSSDGDSKILGESLVILMFEILGGRDMSNIIVNQYSYFASVCPTLVTDEDCNITLVSILSWRRHPQTLSKRSNFYWRDTVLPSFARDNLNSIRWRNFERQTISQVHFTLHYIFQVRHV